MVDQETPNLLAGVRFPPDLPVVSFRIREKMGVFVGTQKDRRIALFENCRKFLIGYEPVRTNTFAESCKLFGIIFSLISEDIDLLKYLKF